MLKSVRVGDYYSNDDNGVWSWYLANLRAGDFEELIDNKLKYTLLKRFLNKHLLSNVMGREPTTPNNKKILFVSIPEDIHQDISILELFLKDYFHLQNLSNIQISKLTDNKVYNHENHYFLVDEYNNFQDPTFLGLGRSTWKAEGTAGTVYDPRRNDTLNNDDDKIAATLAVNVDKLDSENSNTTDGTRHNNGGGNESVRPTLSSQVSSINCTSSLSSISSTGVDSLNEELRMQRTIDNHQPEDDKATVPQSRGSRIDYRDEEGSTDQNGSNSTKVLTQNGTSDADTDEFVTNREDFDSYSEQDGNPPIDTASSIVLNFAPTHKRGLQNKRNKVSNLLSEKYPSDFYTPPQSEMVSINSFGTPDDYAGQSLKLMITKNKNRSSDDDDDDDDYEGKMEDIEGMQPICELSRDMGRHDVEPIANNDELESTTSHSSSSVISSEVVSEDSLNDSASELTLMSILPSISIFDVLGYFRLVLQSIIIVDPESKEIFTAIRQSNNKPTIADITDDWLLYDSDFSLGNLRILSLQDIMDIKRDYPKILFYTMVSVKNRSEIACEFTHSGHGFTKSPTPVMNKVHEEDIEDNDNPVEVQEYFPNPQPLTAEDVYHNDDNNGAGLQVAERTKSNMTTTHRSIRTVNSIGDWPLDISGGATRTTTNTSYAYDDPELTLKFDESSKNMMNKNRKDGSGGKYSKNYLSKVNTNGSNAPLDSVERTKSLPLPTLLKSLSHADDHQHTESKSKWKFRSMRRNKKKSKASSSHDHHGTTMNNNKKDDSSCSIM